MFSKIGRFILAALSGTILCSFNQEPAAPQVQIPFLSPQQKPSSYHEGRPHKTKKSKKEKAEKQKESIKENCKSTNLANQKNRLAYFADHDGFIWFNTNENKYSYFLSNFFPSRITIWNMNFYNADAAYQAAKFLDKPEIAVRFTHLNGEEASKLSQKLNYQRRPDWYQVREKIMLEVVRAKFDQNPELIELLLATGDAYLVLHADRDVLWTDSGDGSGKNRLGQFLMQIRAEKGGIGRVPKPEKYKVKCVTNPNLR